MIMSIAIMVLSLSAGSVFAFDQWPVSGQIWDRLHGGGAGDVAFSVQETNVRMHFSYDITMILQWKNRQSSMSPPSPH